MITRSKFSEAFNDSKSAIEDLRNKSEKKIQDELDEFVICLERVLNRLEVYSSFKKNIENKMIQVPIVAAALNIEYPKVN